MAIPSRAYVGMTVFGLIATLLTVPYTIAVLSGYTPPALSTELSFEAAERPALTLLLIMASLMSIGMTIGAWRRLVEGAREDRKVRENRAKLAREVKQYQRGPKGPT